MMELHTFVRFHAREGNDEAVAQAMRDTADDVRGEEGCVFIEYHRVIRDPRLFYIHSCWKDEAAFQGPRGIAPHRALPQSPAPGRPRTGPDSHQAVAIGLA
jgi:heme-degrading monooxygenase HmoA